MRKLLNKPWFVALLALAALVLIGRKYLAPATAAPEWRPEIEPPAKAVAAPVGTRPPEAAVLPPPPRPGRELRDPFALPTRASPPAPGPEAGPEPGERLHLSACWIQGDIALLVLNGRICQPGDRGRLYRIDSAALEGAWIEHAEGRSFLPVGEELVLRNSIPAPGPPSQ